MAKVYRMNRIELYPGVDEKEYETFAVNELLPQYQGVPGIKAHLFKGDRGERAGKYLAVAEIESVERRDQLFPSAEQPSEEVQQWMASFADAREKAVKYRPNTDPMLSTDYVVIVGSDSTGALYSLHRVELNPGVDEQEYERFFADEAAPAYARVPGVKGNLLKGDRGERAGKYLVVAEIESVERRDQLFPTSGQPSEEAQQWLADVADITKKADKYSSGGDPLFTDYVVIY